MALDENPVNKETIVESSGEELKATLKKEDDGPEQIEIEVEDENSRLASTCLLYTSPSPRDGLLSRMPSSA